MARRAIRYTGPARRDLALIGRWIARDSGRRRADLVIRVIRKRCEVLRHMPRIGRAAPELGSDIRQLVVSPYLVLYRLVPDGVEIARVVDGRRDVPKLMKDRDDDPDAGG